MFKRTRRLSAKGRIVFQRTLHSPFFSLFFKPNDVRNSRFRFVVSKKIDKRAVVRNRIKRLLYASVASIEHELQGGYDMLFVTKKNILSASLDQLISSIRGLFVKEGLLR